MLTYCLCCGQSLWQRGRLKGLPVGVRIAFDPERRRVWTVCDRCHAWNLWLLRDRLVALPVLEGAAASARLLYQSDNVALLEARGHELIRVGPTELPEEAWWRYGRELRRRRVDYRRRLSMVGAAAYAVISHVGANIGLERITGDFRLADELHADVMRWRRFGRTAWSGRAACPQCHSVLLKLLYSRSEFLILLPSNDEGPTIGLPCLRCDRWAVHKVHRFDGRAAERVLRRVLAHRNIEGASDEELAGALQMITAAGSAQQLVREMAGARAQLHGLDRTSSLALEISVNENAERRLLALEAAALEASWRRAEELAAIIDEEL